MGTALVTGSSSGIGRSAARAIARQGHTVVVHGRDESRCQETVEMITADGGSASWLIADLTDADATIALGEQALARSAGRIDMLVNNAGGGGFQPTAEATPESFAATFALNARAPLLLTGLLAPRMAERGDGAIVNVTGLSGEQAVGGVSLFAGACGAVTSMARVWAAEYGPYGVRVNTVSPGIVLTRVNAAMHDMVRELAKTQPSGRPASPDEVGEVIAFLASPAASYLHGTLIPVDGGRLAVRETVLPPDATSRVRVDEG